MFSLQAFAEAPAGVDKLKQVLVDSTMKDCEYLEKIISSKHKDQAKSNPEFFKKNVMLTTCVAHLIRPKESCMTNSFNKIMDEGKGLPKDKAEAVAKKEQAQTKNCLEAAIRDVKVKLEDAAVDRQKAQVLMKAAETTIKGF